MVDRYGCLCYKIISEWEVCMERKKVRLSSIVSGVIVDSAFVLSGSLNKASVLVLVMSSSCHS